MNNKYDQTVNIVSRFKPSIKQLKMYLQKKNMKTKIQHCFLFIDFCFDLIGGIANR